MLESSGMLHKRDLQEDNALNGLMQILYGSDLGIFKTTEV